MALGWPSVEWGLAHISSHELSEWQCFYALEPFGEERADVRAAIVAKTVADVNRPKGKRPYKLESFMPQYDRAPHPDSNDGDGSNWQGLLRKIEMLNAAFHGTDRRKVS